MRGVVLVTACALAGCASNPEPPPVLPAPVLCEVPSGMTETREPPAPPDGEPLMQRAVADYITRLHEWGREGWQRLDAVGQRIEDSQTKEPQ
ncbi:MAG: hypothetical protein ACLFTX_04480 [Thiohalospira sp.]